MGGGAVSAHQRYLGAKLVHTAQFKQCSAECYFRHIFWSKLFILLGNIHGIIPIALTLQRYRGLITAYNYAVSLWIYFLTYRLKGYYKVTVFQIGNI